ncbi:MAG: phosphatase PAP2 family protein [Flavobacteriaceae bacterium]|nr:MAG: phosphatase PAP2 family protein [Flavobacteriaceae bacterium]
MIDTLLDLDAELLIFLNNLGNECWDGFWLLATQPLTWLPLLLLLSILFIKIFNIRKAILIMLSIGFGAFAILNLVNLIKNTVERLRPVNDHLINSDLRILISPSDFSFLSGHATVSCFVGFFVYLLCRNRLKYAWLFFLFPIIFGYSRLYLAVHYPSDIFAGAILGFLTALLFYKVAKRFLHL